MQQSYLQLLSIIEAYANGHSMVKRFHSDFAEQLPNFATSGNTFPVLYVEPIDNTYQLNTNEYNVRIYCFDRLAKDRSNANQVLTDTDFILNGLKVWLSELNTELPVTLMGDPQALPLNNFALDYCAGWSMDCRIEVDGLTLCDIPFANNPVISGYTCDVYYSNEYLRCSDLEGCPTIQDIQADLVSLSGAISGTANYYTTGATLQGTQAVFNRNDQVNAYILELSGLTSGITFSGDYLPLSGGSVTGPSTFKALTADTLTLTGGSFFSQVSGQPAIWFNQALPGTSNFALLGSSTTDTYLNATSQVYFTIGGNLVATYTNSRFRFAVPVTDSSNVNAINTNARALFDSTGQQSILWDNRAANDSLSNPSLDWQQRALYRSTGTMALRWSTSLLQDVSGNTILDWSNGAKFTGVISGTSFQGNGGGYISSLSGTGLFGGVGGSIEGGQVGVSSLLRLASGVELQFGNTFTKISGGQATSLPTTHVNLLGAKFTNLPGNASTNTILEINDDFTGGTNSLFEVIKNSSSVFRVSANGIIRVQGRNTNATLQMQSPTGAYNPQIDFYYDGSNYAGFIGTDNNSLVFGGAALNQFRSANNQFGTSFIGGNDAIIQAKGTTNDSTAYIFKASNSSLTTHFSIRNDGRIESGGTSLETIIRQKEITGGTYNALSGITTFYKQDGNSFDVTGYDGTWVNWSGSANVQGVSAITVNQIWYTKNQNTIKLWFNITATSTATTFSFTLPFPPHNAYGASGLAGLCHVINGATASAGRVTGSGGSTTLAITSTVAGAAFATSGAKYARGFIEYMI